PPPDLGPPGTRRRVRHAERALREAAQALVPVLRSAPDRSAAFPCDGQPAEYPLLPRLRARLLLPERADDLRRDRDHVLRQLGALAGGDRDDGPDRRLRVPLLARRPSRAARRPAEDGRRRDRRG